MKLVCIAGSLAILSLGYGCQRSQSTSEAFNSIVHETNTAVQDRLEQQFALRGVAVRPFLFEKLMSFDEQNETTAFDILIRQPETLNGFDFTPFFKNCPKDQLIVGSIVWVLGKSQPASMPRYLSTYLSRRAGSSQIVEIFVDSSYNSTLELVKSRSLKADALDRLARLSESKYWNDPKTRLLTTLQLSRLKEVLRTQRR